MKSMLLRLLPTSLLILVSDGLAQVPPDPGIESFFNSVVVPSEIGTYENGTTYITYPAVATNRYTLRSGFEVNALVNLVSTNHGTPSGNPEIGFFQVVPDKQTMFYVVDSTPIPLFNGLFAVPTSVPAPAMPNGFDEVISNPILRWSPLDAKVAEGLRQPVLCRAQVFSSEGFDPAAPDFESQITAAAPVFETLAPYTAFASVESGLNPGRIYYWRVRVETGVDGFWRWSALARFATPSSSLVPPTITSPMIVFGPDGTRSGDTNSLATLPTLKWTGVSKAEAYRLELYPEDPEAPGFPDMAARISGTTLSSNATLQFAWPASVPLTRGKNYFWRIRSQASDLKFSTWSQFAQFYVRTL